MTSMIVGNLSLALAVLIAAVAVLLAIASARFDSRAVLRATRGLIVTFAILLTLASGALVAALLKNEFSIQYVAHYTERSLPVGYKLAAFWAGQEGSLLLWAWLVAVMGAIFVATDRREPGRESAAVLATLCGVLFFFAALMLFAANPFLPIDEVPIDGRGLNPMLQDPAMIAHPPALFLGYAGFTIPFAIMIGALVARRRDNDWVDGLRRWSLASWLFLSIGILLGAQWAYVELGWGGYWAWDPVENASLLPWLTGTALLHSIMGQKHRGVLKRWNVSLIAITFALCIFGTYLTRSGVIQSVHSFGESVIGTFFLTFLVITIVASVILIVWRRKALRPDRELETLVGREGMFLATNVLLVGIMLITLIGTIFPIISRVFSGQQVTVGPSFYNKVVAPMALLLVALMATGPLLGYGAGAGAAKRLARGMIAPTLVVPVVVACFWLRGIRDAWALVCVVIATVAIVNVTIDLFRTFIVRDRVFNHRRLAAQMVHIGIVLIVAGITGSSVFNIKQTFQLHLDESVQFAGRTMKFSGLAEVRRANYTAVEATLTLTEPNGIERVFKPQRRFYDKAQEANSEVAIGSSWKEDVYLTLAGWESGGAVTAIQVIVNPLVSWIWTGGVLLSAGAVVGLLPRLTTRRANVEQRESTPTKRDPTRGRRTVRVPATA